MKNKQIRQFIIAALDDDNGINETAFDLLREFTFLDDIVNASSVLDDRYYLPEGHAIEA